METDRFREEAVRRFGESFVKSTEDRGYTFGQYKGEGNTRIAVEVEYRKGDVHRRGVMKIPKLEVPDSVQAQIAREKDRNWSLEEILVTNVLGHHPNIVRPFESFSADGIGTVVVEENLGAWATDAETLMKRAGPLYASGKAKDVLKDVSEAVGYLHSRGIVHRDIKPSNVLITDEGVGMLSDLQTARHWRNIEKSTMPTRGGTAYTHPDLLNALLTSKPCAADFESDLYSLGATAYSFLTGEKPFSWKLRAKDGGRGFILADQGGLEDETNLVWKDREISMLSDEEHERELARMEKTMKEKRISRGWRQLVLRSMTQDEKKKPFGNLGEFRGHLEELSDDIYDSFREQSKRAARAGIFTGLAASVFGGLIIGMLNISSCEQRYNIPARTPSLTENVYSMMGPRERASAELPVAESDKVHDELRDAYKSLVDEPFLTKNPERFRYGLAKWCSEIHGIKPRIASAIAYATDLSPECVEEYKRIGQDRLPRCNIPKEVADSELKYSFMYKPGDENYLGEAENASVLYLKGKISSDRDPFEVFANYYATSRQIAEAQIATKSASYLPNYDNTGAVISPGYASGLPAFQRNLINRAAALYQVTDEDGRIQPNRLRFYLDQSLEVSSKRVVRGEEHK